MKTSIPRFTVDHRFDWCEANNRSCVLTDEAVWSAPRSWNEKAKTEKTVRRIGCSLTVDLFARQDALLRDCDNNEIDVALGGSNYWISVPKGMVVKTPTRPLSHVDIFARIYKLVKATPQLHWLIRTDYPEHVESFLHTVEPTARCLPDNFWIGISADQQETLTKRIRNLITVPATVRFVSVDPTSSPLDLGEWIGPYWCPACQRHSQYPAVRRHCPNCGHEGDWDDNDEPCPECKEDVETEMVCERCGVDGGNGGLDFNMCWDVEPDIQRVFLVESGDTRKPTYEPWVDDIVEQCRESKIVIATLPKPK